MLHQSDLSLLFELLLSNRVLVIQLLLHLVLLLIELVLKPLASLFKSLLKLCFLGLLLGLQLAKGVVNGWLLACKQCL